MGFIRITGQLFMIEQIQQTLFLMVTVTLLVNWLITRSFYEYRDPPLWYMFVTVILIVLGSVGVFGIAFYRVWA